MTLGASDDRMTLEIANVTIADAKMRADGRWQVSTWPEPVDRDQAITAMTIAGLLADGYPDGNPLVVALRAELA